MELSELTNGQSAYIQKVNGRGAFRKRINEMGFVVGTKIKAIKKAPLQDPVEYELMGYRVSLRMSEAAMIEVSDTIDSCVDNNEPFKGMIADGDYTTTNGDVTTKKITVALVGNPNCGKTTLFNHATGSRERVGNYSGVTVDMKTAVWNYGGYRIELADLPGTYSLSEYSPEELYVSDCLTGNTPDVVINMVDASNLERNLFLTTQLIDMDVKVVIALNMYDELIAKGDSLDYDTLGKMLGIPIVPTTASKGIGIDELCRCIIEIHEDRNSTYRHLHINFGDDINSALTHIKAKIHRESGLSLKYHRQYVAIKLLERDSHVMDIVKSYEESDEIICTAKEEVEKIERYYGNLSDAVIADARYSFIRGALKETYVTKNEANRRGYGADIVLTNKWFGIPVFLLILGLMFQITFSLGNYPMEWIESGIGLLSEFVDSVIPNGILNDLIVDGVIAGVGGVLVFLPNIILLFLFISLLEDSGYMARAAFIMDKLMHKIGLHGKSFIPMLMGFGCNVPAVLATRTLENRKDRLVTMLIIPFMSCSARLPIYILLVSAFFSAYKGLILLSIYVVGILIAILSALIFNKIVLRRNEAPFVMELPPYRMPSPRNTLRHTWVKSKQYISKMGGIILVASILIWSLGYFPRNENPQTGGQSQIESSYIAQLGHFISPVIEPLGYDWKIGVSLISGVAAKEIVVSTMSVLYHSDSDEDLASILKEQRFTSGDKVGEPVYSPLIAYSLMMFILIYFPCIAVVAAIKKEAGIKWAILCVIYTTSLAWVVTFAINQIGSLFV